MLTGDTCNHRGLGKFFSAIQINQTLDRVLGPEPAGVQPCGAPARAPWWEISRFLPRALGAPARHLFA